MRVQFNLIIILVILYFLTTTKSIDPVEQMEDDLDDMWSGAKDAVKDMWSYWVGK